MRVSAVDFLNAAPLTWGLRAGRHPRSWEISYDTPSRCADKVLAGEAELGLVPSIEFLGHPNLRLAAPLCIASRREVTSVLLFAAGPLKSVGTVLLDAASRTSQALVKVLLSEVVSPPPRFMEAEALPAELSPGEAVLVIGDRALDLPRGLLATERHDLAEWWNRRTGLPFVFAVWAGVKEACTEETRRVLEESLAYGKSNVDAIIAAHTSKVGLSPEQIRSYLVNHLAYTLGEEEREALHRFAAMTAGDTHGEGSVAETETRF